MADMVLTADVLLRNYSLTCQRKQLFTVIVVSWVTVL